MNKYNEMRERHQKSINEFEGLGFAFSEEQFNEMCKELGIEPKDAKEKLYRIGSIGGFVLKDRNDALKELLNKNTAELEKAMKDEDFVFDAFNYELSNHEYIVTYDATDALEALGLTNEDIFNNKMYQDQLSKAMKHQIDVYNKREEVE